MSPLEENSSREFTGPSELTGMDRRDFFRYLGMFSSMTLLAQCSRQAQTIVPFLEDTEAFSEKNYSWFASAAPAEGFGQGVLLKSYQGRPIKVEGNPKHPLSLGATSARAQGALYELFHPDRLHASVINGKKSSLIDVEKKLGALENFAVIFPAYHSPTMSRLIREAQKKHPTSLWVSLSPWKKTDFTSYDLSQVTTVVSFGEDLFSLRPDSLSLARAFMEKRTNAIAANDPEKLNRLLVLETGPTHAGAKADEVKRAPRSVVWNSALELLNLLEGKSSDDGLMKSWRKHLGKDSVVAISRDLHPDAAALERKINTLLGSTAHKSFSFPLPENTSEAELLKKIDAGEVTTLVILETDLAYLSLRWRKALAKVKTNIAAAHFPTETTALSDVVIPLHHWAESWGDLLSPHGTITIQQPLIDPLHQSFNILSLISAISGQKGSPKDMVKETHHLSDASWEDALRKGVLAGKIPDAHPEEKKSFLPLKEKRWDLVVTPDPFIGFGEHADNPLLQELPRPFFRQSWSNVLAVSEKEGKKLGVKTGDKIEVTTSEGTFSGTAHVGPLIPEGTLYTTAGFGTREGTKIARARGFKAYPYKFADVLSVKKARGNRLPARTQENLSSEGFSPVKSATLPLLAATEKKIPLSLYPESPLKAQDEGPRWAMTIDLTSCIGCEACVSSCQVENNIPFVGEDQAKKNRTLHWLRIDTYLQDDRVSFQPVPCMHCEKAPCEVVCPVNATVHGDGGLNEMIYNRCVGTRYCSNNCPYKVRRFNFKTYSVLKEPWNLGLNPDVSVRDRGVMEKCTFCVQRIKTGERTGEEITTACQSVCPTKAIVFGDLRKTESLLVQNKKSARNYDLLEDEGTRPRTSYLKEVRRERGS